MKMTNLNSYLSCLITLALVPVYGEIFEERFTLTSTNCASNNRDIGSASILVSDVEHSQQTDGLNIVVYDIQKSLVLHTISFANPNTRTFLDFIDRLPPGVLILGTSQILCKEQSAVAFDTQRSVLYAMRRLGLNTKGIKPLVFRSAVFAYCKESCYPNMTLSVLLPFSKVHNINQGPILFSFTIETDWSSTVSFHHATGSSANKSEDSHDHVTLYAVIISCSLFICLTICAVGLFFIKRRQTENQSAEISERVYHEKTNNGSTSNGKCELLYISKEKSECYRQQRYEPTTSARLFSLYSNNTETEDSETQMNMDGFASYVRVETEDCQLVYKVPSGVSKHDPPSFQPDHKPTTRNGRESAFLPSEYLNPHDYERPGDDNHYVSAGYQGHTSVYQEVEESHEEYMSLEPPYCEDQYNEPIYDSCDSFCSVEYHVPNCEI